LHSKERREGECRRGPYHENYESYPHFDAPLQEI